MPTASVIVRTYNAPRELDLVLEGLARQSVMPMEVVVADDGSRGELMGGFKRWERVYPTKLIRVSQEDMGFRKGLISNKAVASAAGEELLFIDGDAVPHRDWVADHLAAAEKAEVRCGRRVKLGPNLSPRIDCEVVRSGALEFLFGPVLRYAVKGDTQRFFLGVRLPSVLASAFHPRPRKLMGVNFSVSRAAFERVNGFDNDWTHRRPDKDLDLRLRRSGANYMALLNRAVVYHIFHSERTCSATTEKRVMKEEQSTRIQAENGLRQVAIPEAVV
jgi:GT2 family glycosyltransferase